MKIQNISVIKFDSIKDNLKEFLNETFTDYPYDVLQFSQELTEEDHKIIYASADGFKLSKNLVNEEDYDMLANKDEDKKYEIVMSIGRRFMNKINRQPTYNMGLLIVIKEQIKFQTNMIIGLMGLIVLSKLM
jgi:hypothetical protein